MNKRKVVLIMSILLITLLIGSLLWRFVSPKADRLGEAISMEAYKSYDTYGFPYDQDELEVFDMLDEILDKTHFEKTLKTENHTIYVTTYEDDIDLISSMLRPAEVIRQIAYSEATDSQGDLFRSYWVDYRDRDRNRVMIEYYSNGRARKTIGYVKEDLVVTVDNQLTKDTYSVDIVDENPLFYTEAWSMVADKEYANYDSFAGSGLYFHQLSNDAYCTLMIYGSGVQVVTAYTSQLTVGNDGTWTIKLPKKLSTGVLEDSDKVNLVKVSIDVGEDTVSIGDRVFTYEAEAHNYDFIYGELEKTTGYQHRIEATLSAYALTMSSTPGLPMKSICTLEDDSLDLSLEYTVDQGDFIIYDGQYVKQVGKSTTMDFEDHMIYWTPLADGYDGMTDNRNYATLTINIINKETGHVESSEVHRIIQAKGYFALDDLPQLPNNDHVIQEGFAIYPLEARLPSGPYPEAPVGAYVIGQSPLFTEDDLLSVDFEHQIYLFKEAFLQKMNSDESGLDDDMGGSVLLGRHHHQFVVVVDGESLYEGYFEPSIWSSFMPSGAIIRDVADKGIQITYGESSNSDPRFDERIKEALRDFVDEKE